MDNRRIDGRRILVVGASAGIGRVIGQRLSAAGAHVAFASRRREICEELADESKGVAIGLGCDVTDESQCFRLISDTVNGLGGLDHVVYSTGAIPVVALAAADTEWWRRTFETNVMGASLITRAALPHLKSSKGSVIYLSSVSSIGPAWPGMGVYTATKAALNRMVDTWRSEHPELGFTRIFIGATNNASREARFDASAWEHMARWAVMGVRSGATTTPDCVAQAVELVIESNSRIWDITVAPKDPPLPWEFDADALMA